MFASNERFDTLVELLEHRAVHQRDQAAYHFLADGETVSETITYGQLAVRARRLAAELRRLAAPGDRVLLLIPSGLDFIAAFMGCMYAGVVAVPAYPPRNIHKMDRIQGMLVDCEPSVALTTREHLALVQSWLSRHDAFRGIASLVEGELGAPESEWAPPAIERDSLAFLQYTSGSTSAPKGVMVTQGNLVYNCAYMTASYGLSRHTISVSWLPVYHDMGLIEGILHPMFTGYPAYLMAPMSFLLRPARWLEAIASFGATHSGAPNFAYELCLRKVPESQRASLDLSRWTTAYNGAEPVRADTLQRFGAAFAVSGFRPQVHYPCYGLAEATLMVSGGEPTAMPVLLSVSRPAYEQQRIELVAPGPEAKTLVASGKVRGDTTVAIVHPEGHRRCAPGEVGEIWVGGPTVARGYWRRPEESERVFGARIAGSEEGPFLRTGDLGYMHGDELVVTGRLKDVIILGGRNYYPQDIELTVERSHAAIRPGCAAAISIEIDDEERLVVLAEVERRYLRGDPTEGNIVAMEGRLDSFEPLRSKLDLQEVYDSILEAVARDHELPVHAIGLLMATSIPKTSSGKIRRQACKQGMRDGTLKVLAEWTATVPVT